MKILDEEMPTSTFKSEGVPNILRKRKGSKAAVESQNENEPVVAKRDIDEDAWDTEMSHLVETPSKTLTSDSSVIFSPSSLMRDALDDSELFLNDNEDEISFKRRNREPAPKVLDPKWEKYACGQTKDQLYMTNLARMVLSKLSLQPRSLNFI